MCRLQIWLYFWLRRSQGLQEAKVLIPFSASANGSICNVNHAAQIQTQRIKPFTAILGDGGEDIDTSVRPGIHER